MSLSKIEEDFLSQRCVQVQVILSQTMYTVDLGIIIREPTEEMEDGVTNLLVSLLKAIRLQEDLLFKEGLGYHHLT